MCGDFPLICWNSPSGVLGETCSSPLLSTRAPQSRSPLLGICGLRIHVILDSLGAASVQEDFVAPR